MEKENYILGSGIAGLIYAYYNKSFKVIGSEIGGQMNNQFPLGPRYLHETPQAKMFLEQLGFPINSITIRTGYQTVVGKIYDVMFDQGFRKKYYMKSRGLKDLSGYDDTSMSSGKSSFRALEVDFNKLIEKIVSIIHDRIIVDKVLQINPEEQSILLESGQKLFYNQMVNTLPLNIFSKILVRTNSTLFPSPDNFKSEHITYIWLKPKPFSYFNYIYIAALSVPHHRLTYDEKGVIVEWFGIHSEEECKKHYKDEFIACKTLYGSQIIPVSFAHNLKNIRFVGRYGTWDRHWKTEKVIEVAMQDAAKEILNE